VKKGASRERAEADTERQQEKHDSLLWPRTGSENRPLSAERETNEGRGADVSSGFKARKQWGVETRERLADESDLSKN